MAELRVYAVAGKEVTYSVKDTSYSKYVDGLNYKFNWYIQGNDPLERYGTFVNNIVNHESVTIIWKNPSIEEGSPSPDRILICEVIKINSQGEDIGCEATLTLNVVVSENITNLEVLTFEGIEGSEIVDNVTGEVKLLNQCHVIGETFAFKVTGNSETTKFKIDLINPNATSAANYPYKGTFMDENGNILTNVEVGKYEYAANNNHSATIFIKFIGKPFLDGFYYIRAFAMNNLNEVSDPLVIKLKLAWADVISIVDTDYEFNIKLAEPPLIFNWKKNFINWIPSWFVFDSYYQVGKIIDNGSDPNNDDNFIGDNWAAEDRILIESKTISQLYEDELVDITNPVNHYYNISYDEILLPDIFYPDGWTYGNIDKFKVRYTGVLRDPEDPTCSTDITPIKSQLIKLNYCSPSPAIDGSYSFKAHSCPNDLTLSSLGQYKFTSIPQVCATETHWDSVGNTCVWDQGATTPCIGKTGTHWDIPSQTCVCNIGFQYVEGVGCVTSSDPTCYEMTSITPATGVCADIGCIEYESNGNIDSTSVCYYSLDTYSYYVGPPNYYKPKTINIQYIEYTHSNLPSCVASGDYVYYNKSRGYFYNPITNDASMKTYTTINKTYTSTDMDNCLS